MPSKNDKCECCGSLIGDNAYCKWEGPPFSRRAIREICYVCICALRPTTLKENDGDLGIAIIGTYSGDILRLSELIADGFGKAEATRSIKSVGKHLDLPPFTIKKRLTS